MKHSSVFLPALLFVVASTATGAAPAASPPLDSSQRLRRTPIVEAFARAKDAVVNISCTQVVELQMGFGGIFDNFDLPPPFRRRLEQRMIQSVGSGFVLHPDGYVVTNAHVILKTKDQHVICADKNKYPARAISIDTRNDLAILKIDAARPLPALPLGRSDDLMIGETVLAIGDPLGYEHTLTTGIISALNRTLTFDRGIEYTGLIQTDAPINPGNSGGPLLNILGELIGITTAIRGDAQNIGFAIPVDVLRRALPGMLSLERLKRVRLGMKASGRHDVRVVEVSEQSPALAAGIEPGDRILAIDGRRIEQDVDFYIYLLSRKANDRVVLRLERGGRERSATLTLRAIPIPDGGKLAREKFGLRITPLSADLARELELQSGLVITAVEPDSPAAAAGIERGMIIVTIAGDFPRDLDHVGLLLEDVQRGEAVVFRIWRVTRQGIWGSEVALRAR